MNDIFKIPFYQRKKNVPPPIKNLKLTPFNEEFGKLTNPIIGKDDQRPVMMGNSFEPETNSIVGTDAHKLYRIEMGEESKKYDGVYKTIQNLEKEYNKIWVSDKPSFKEYKEEYGKITDYSYPKWEAIIVPPTIVKEKIDVQKLWWFSTVLSKATYVETEDLKDDVKELYHKNKIGYLSGLYKDALNEAKAIFLQFIDDDGEWRIISFNAKFLSAITKFMLQLNQHECYVGLRGQSQATLFSFDNMFSATSSNFCLLMPLFIDFETKLATDDRPYDLSLREDIFCYNLENNTIFSNGKEIEINEDLGFKPRSYKTVSTSSKKFMIFNPNGYGENLNELFNEWNVAKTEADYNNWKEKVCRSFVGTYQNEMLSDKVDKFVLDKHNDSFQFKSFKKELENAYKWCFKKYDKKEIDDLNRPQELTGQSFENLVQYDWDFEFSTGSLKGEKFSNQKIEAIDVYDDSYYTLNFMSGGIYTATTSDMVNLLSITDNVVKISVIFDDNNVKSNQKIKRRIKSFADKSGRLIVENNSNDKIDKRQFPYLLVSKKDSENYDLASIFYGRLETPNKVFKNDLINKYKNHNKSKENITGLEDEQQPQELTGQSFENLVHSVQGESFQYTEKMYPNKKAVGFIRITGTPIDRLGGATTVPKEEAFVGNIITLDNGEKAKILYVRKSNKELLEEYGDDEEVKPKKKSIRQQVLDGRKFDIGDVVKYETLNRQGERVEKTGTITDWNLQNRGILYKIDNKIVSDLNVKKRIDNEQKSIHKERLEKESKIEAMKSKVKLYEMLLKTTTGEKKKAVESKVKLYGMLLKNVN